MEITAVVALADAAITLLEKAVPQIQKAVAGGEVDPATQKALSDRLDALKASGFAFTRPTGTT